MGPIISGRTGRFGQIWWWLSWRQVEFQVAILLVFGILWYCCRLPLPETNSKTHLKIDAWKTFSFPFEFRPIRRVCVSFKFARFFFVGDQLLFCLFSSASSKPFKLIVNLTVSVGYGALPVTVDFFPVSLLMLWGWLFVVESEGYNRNPGIPY